MTAIPDIPLRLLRAAALDAGVHERTGLRVTLGLPVRPAGRERFIEALAKLGVDTSKLPAPTVTPTARGSLQLGARHGTAVPTPAKRT